MKKEEIKTVLKQLHMPLHDDGPTVIIVEKEKKQTPIQVIKKKDHIEATTGKIIKKTIRIPLNELE